MPESMTLGAYLAARRETGGLSVEDVATRTRIVPRFIHALEGDRPLDLPAPVYVRGFVRAYCEAVGADADHARGLYEATRQPEGIRAVTLVSVARPVLVTRHRRGRGRWLVGAGLALVALIALYPVGVKWAERRQSGDRPLIPSAQVNSVSPSASVTVSAGSDVVTGVGEERTQTEPVSGSTVVASPPPATAADGSAAPAASEATGVRTLVVRASDTTWVRVKPEDEPASVVTLSPGATHKWRSAGRFRVTLGNAGGVRLELDGKSLPVLGSRGEVVRDVLIPLEPGS